MLDNPLNDLLETASALLDNTAATIHELSARYVRARLVVTDTEAESYFHAGRAEAYLQGVSLLTRRSVASVRRELDAEVHAQREREAQTRLATQHV